ncbi:hypothetical protein BASA81_005425 [Batrachochytrium salamandrivorans]|nr:hypothetical protein BASA81_005425 [Batrachochytrium salamandrivorans]
MGEMSAASTTNLKKTINWRPKGNSGWNALHLAASTGDLPNLRTYILYSKLDSEDDKLSLSSKRESKLDIATKQGDTAFHIAMRKGHGQAARELAKAGCNVTLPGSRGETALHLASSRGMIEELQWLIQEHKMNVHTSASLATGQYSQHFAAEEDRCDTLRYLKTLGVDFSMTDLQGETCFHVACRNGSVGAILWLAEQDYSLTKRVNKNNKDGEALAKECGWTEAAERIAFLNRSKKRERKTSLEFHKLLSAGDRNLDQVLQWVSAVSGTSLISLIDTWNLKSGTNAVLEACVGGKVETVRFLCKQVAGERKLLNCKTGSTALHIASANNNLELVGFLLDEMEMDPSVADVSGATPLSLAEPFPEVHKVLKAFADKQQQRQRQERQGTSAIGAAEGSSSASSDGSSSGGVNEDVRAILDRVGLVGPQWATKLAEDGFVTVANLLHILESDLVEMNMPKGFRRALLTEVDRLKKQDKRLKVPIQKVDLFLSKHPLLPDEMQIELVMSPSLSFHLVKQNQNFSCSCGAAVLPCEHVLLFRSPIRRTLSSEIPQHFLIQAQELSVERVIGEGSYGVVRLATWRGMKVAVKELKGTHQEAELRREASTMARVSNHDHVIPLVGMVLEPVPSVVMAFMCGGSVEDLLFGAKSSSPGDDDAAMLLPWYAVLKLIKEAACGVMHLHFQQVIHRDLSARNLLVDANGAVRVADFGFARIKEDHLSKGYTQSHVGPIKWMSPEAIRERKFSEKSDVFSFGVTMFEIIARERPWALKDSMDVVFRVCSGERMNIRHLAPWDQSMQQIMIRCWAQTPEQRPSMKEVLEWVEVAWRNAGGDVAVDPTGGIMAFAGRPQPELGGEDGNSFSVDSNGYNMDFHHV